MQVCRYSSQKSTERPKCKDLQRTLHPIRAHQTQNNPEVRRCRVSVLNRISSTLPLSLFLKNHARTYTYSLKGFFLKPAAGSQSPAASSGRGDWNKMLRLWNKKVLFLILGKVIFDICWLTWGAERAIWTLYGRSCKQKPSFHQKVSPGAHCGALLASAGQLVAPSGLLFELLFVTLGRCWGPPGPKLPKDIKMDQK